MAAVDPDGLTGWKEIAQYFNKGVRTVQRWEKEYGLPVQRIGRDGGEIILASRAELSDWKRRNARRTQIASDEPTDALPVSAATTPVTSAPSRVPLFAGLGVVLVALAVWLVVAQLSLGRPARWFVEDGALRVQDRTGAILWSPSIGFRIEDAAYASESPKLTKVVIQDLDGDARPEVIFGAWAPGKDARSAFFLFNADGSLRKVIRPSSKVRFGDITYAGPWLPHLAFVVDRPGEVPATFLSFIDEHDFPTLLLEIDGMGEPVAEYWSDGYIDSVSLATWHGERALLVTAATNDITARGGSVAIFPGGHARGSAPSGSDAFRCLDCPAGGPAEFIAFPRRCMSALDDGTGPVTEAHVTLADELVAYSSDGPRQPGGGFKSTVIYTMTPDIRVSRIEVVGGTRTAHEAMERAGVFVSRHNLASDLWSLVPVRRWSGGRWTEVPLKGPLDSVLVLPGGLSLPPRPMASANATSRHNTPDSIWR